MLLSENGRALYVVAVRGDGRNTLLGARLNVGEGIAGWVAAQREPLLLDSAVSDPRFSPHYPLADILSALSLPVLTRGKLIGVLNVSSTRRQRAFSLGQINALSLFTNGGAASVEVALLYPEQRRTARVTASLRNGCG